MNSDPLWDEFGPEAMAAGLRVFARIAQRWALRPDQQVPLLGLSDSRELRRLTGDPAPDPKPELLERLSHIFAIWRALHTLFNDPARADTWPSRPNSHPLFGGKPAMKLMASGRLEDLKLVRQYLGAQIA